MNDKDKKPTYTPIYSSEEEAKQPTIEAKDHYLVPSLLANLEAINVAGAEKPDPVTYGAIKGWSDAFFQMRTEGKGSISFSTNPELPSSGRIVDSSGYAITSEQHSPLPTGVQIECLLLVNRINDRVADIQKLREENDVLSGELRRAMRNLKVA